MRLYSPALFASDLACDIRHEYSVLLSFFQDNEKVEEQLFSFYSDILLEHNEDEPVFWFSLAYCEWKKGRLSEVVKNNALKFIDNQQDLKRWETEKNNYKKREKILSDLREKLLSPMPEPKKIKKTKRLRCPWKVGSLLAYQIISNEKAKVMGMYGKYALLRVIKINKNPISWILPTEIYNESMLVGVYGWYGDEIPDESIVDSLEFIPVKDYVTPQLQLDLTPLDKLPEDERDELAKVLIEHAKSKRRIETCASLSWVKSKECPGNMFCIGYDKSFEKDLPDFFKTDITQYSFTSFCSFDITLSKCLKKHKECQSGDCSL